MSNREMAPKTAQAWLDASSSDDDEPADQSPEAQERRQRALQLLAKAFNKPGDKPKSVADAEDEETRFLNSLLTTPPDEMARCVRDRLGARGTRGCPGNRGLSIRLQWLGSACRMRRLSWVDRWRLRILPCSAASSCCVR